MCIVAHWEHGNIVGEHDWEHGDKGTSEGTLMGTSGCALRDMCIGESWI